MSLPKNKPLKTIVHVNQTVIRQNVRDGADNPCITVKNSKSNTYTKHVEILDDNGKVVASVIQSMNKPLSCGARIWVESYGDVRFVGETETASCARKKCLTAAKKAAKKAS
jgi:hypothetical protein